VVVAIDRIGRRWMDLALNGDTRVDSREPRRRGYLSETEGNES
jgi:hypothetical protein